MLVLLALQPRGGRLSIKCAHCGGSHNRVETVRQCAREAGKTPSGLATADPVVLPTSQHPQRFKAGSVPAGFYLVDRDVIVEIRVPAEGRWKGRYFINANNRDGSSEKALFLAKDRAEFVEWLLNHSWQGFMRRYGVSTGRCPACGGNLDYTEVRLGVHDPTRGPYKSACHDIVTGQYTE